MLSDFEKMNATILDVLGTEREVEHNLITVSAVVVDPAGMTEIPLGTQLVLFASRTKSGFEALPVKNDTFEVDEKEYRVFEVRSEQETDGIWIYLEQQR